MERWLEEALDCGLLGLSTMTNPWDKLDGDRHRSAQLPSTYATWGEYRRLHRVLRRRGRILQSAPSLVTKVNAFLFLLESAGFRLRKPLRTTLITLADAKSTPGAASRHRRDHALRQSRPRRRPALADAAGAVRGLRRRHRPRGVRGVRRRPGGAPSRRRGRAQRAHARRGLPPPLPQATTRTRFSPRVWQRDFHDAHIVACPDASVVGRSFGDGRRRARHPPGRRLPRSRRRSTAPSCAGAPPSPTIGRARSSA